MALILPVTLVIGLVHAPAAQATPDDLLPPCKTAEEDVNHASIRLDAPVTGTQVAVDENGKIDVRGVVHKQATMVDVTIDKVTTSGFTLGPPPADESGWAASWTTSMRPPHLGQNLVCARAERAPGRFAKITRAISVVDLIPPSTVPDLTVGNITATTATATWGAATDNYGLAGYEVTVDGGTPQRTTIGNRSYTITGLSPSTNHTVSVVAVDQAGHRSATPATASFTTAAADPPPQVDPGLTIVPEEGIATATWHPDPTSEVAYRISVNGQPWEEVPLDTYCQDASGNPASPCTAQDNISYPIDPLESSTPYVFRFEGLRADGTVARSLAGSFRTTAVEVEVSPATTQLVASEASQCAGAGGDVYASADVRDTVPVPTGSTQLFAGCYAVANTSCLEGFLPPTSQPQRADCADDLTQLLRDTNPGGGPVISSLDDAAGGASARGSAENQLLLAGPQLVPVAWCLQNVPTCTIVLTRGAQIGPLVGAAPPSAAGISWLVVTLGGIGVGLLLWALFEWLWPGQIGIESLIEYPVDHNTDFDTFSDWGQDEGAFLNELKIYAEVIKTTKLLVERNNIDFAWTDGEGFGADHELKEQIGRACRQVPAGYTSCEADLVVYVPGGVNHRFEPMQQTGKHIVDTLKQDPPSTRFNPQWYYPAYSRGGQAAINAGHSPRWYDRAQWRAPIFPDNRCWPGGVRRPAATPVCDEFPFFSTNQAVNLTTPGNVVADLAPVPRVEAGAQGNELSVFYRRCGVDDGDRFLILPVREWVQANGPSFAFTVNQSGADVCLKPGPA